MILGGIKMKDHEFNKLLMLGIGFLIIVSDHSHEGIICGSIWLVGSFLVPKDKE